MGMLHARIIERNNKKYKFTIRYGEVCFSEIFMPLLLAMGNMRASRGDIHSTHGLLFLHFYFIFFFFLIFAIPFRMVIMYVYCVVHGDMLVYFHCDVVLMR